MSNTIVNDNVQVVNIVFTGKAYPEIARINNRITLQTTKDFLYKHGYISLENLTDPDCNYTVITQGLYRAFCDGVLSLNATKQDGVENLTPIRVSTGLSGKLDTVLAISTISLANTFCLARMKNNDLVCSKCYVSESLRIDGILAYTQNLYVLTHFDLAENVNWIPRMKSQWAKDRVKRELEKERALGKIEISDEEIERLHNARPLCRLESMGDLACTLQARNYMTIAYSNIDFDFGLWTKNPAVLASAIDTMGKPENVSTVMSMSRKNVMDPEKMIARYRAYFNHCFIVVDNDNTRDGYLNQSSFYPCQCGHFSCVRCRHCYQVTKDIDTAVERLRDKKQK